MKVGLFVTILAIILTGCASLKKSQLTPHQNELIDHIEKTVEQVSFSLDAQLRFLYADERLTEAETYVIYETSFGSRNGEGPVHQSMRYYCNELGGSYDQRACLIENNDENVAFYYRLASEYNRFSGADTSMKLKVYIPESYPNHQYLVAVRKVGYKTEVDKESERVASSMRSLLRQRELEQMTVPGTKICGSSPLDVAWVEDSSNGKLKVRYVLGSTVSWVLPEDWRICG